MSIRRSCLVLSLPVLAAGCKSADKGGPLGLGLFASRDSSAGSQRAAVDPILTNGRIPPQSLPVPGKDSLTVDAGRDPLFGSPAGRDRDDRPERAASTGKRTPPKPTDETSSTPRMSLPYRPSPASTPAALAGRIDPRDPAMRVGDDPPPVLSVGRADGSAADLTRELKKLGATVSPPALERGEYVCRGEIELDPDGKPGVRRAYETAGATPQAALRQMLEQMRGDRRR